MLGIDAIPCQTQDHQRQAAAQGAAARLMPPSSASSASRSSVREVRARDRRAPRTRPLDRHLDLHHDPPRPRRHDRHAVSEVERLLHVVRDQHDRARLLAQRLREPLLERAARDLVERRERLVEQQQRPPGQERARQRHALSHPAGQLVRPRPFEAAEAEALEQRPRLRHAPALRAPAHSSASAAFAQRSFRHGSSRSRCGMSARGLGGHGPVVGLLQPRQQDSSKVDLPQPEGPTRATTSPLSTVSDRSSRALIQLGANCHSAPLRGHYPTGSKGLISARSRAPPDSRDLTGCLCASSPEGRSPAKKNALQGGEVTQQTPGTNRTRPCTRRTRRCLRPHRRPP